MSTRPNEPIASDGRHRERARALPFPRGEDGRCGWTVRRASDDTRGAGDTRGGVDLIHASLSSAEMLDMSRALGAPLTK